MQTDSIIPASAPDLARCDEAWRSIGGSDIAALMVSEKHPRGLDPFRTHTDVYLRLGWNIGSEETEAMRIGKRAEPFIVDQVCRLRGCTIDGGGRTWRGEMSVGGVMIPVRAQADSLAQHVGDRILIESKWTSRHNEPWTITPDVCPAQYVAQTIWGMGHRGIKRALVGMGWGYGDDEITTWEVLFDEAVFEYQKALAAKFWLDHFVPDADGKLHPWTPVDPAAHAALAKAMWPRVSEPVIVEVTGTDAELVIAAAEAHEKKAIAEKAWTPFKDTLTAMIGPREGVKAGGVQWTYTGSKNNPEKRTLRRKEHVNGV